VSSGERETAAPSHTPVVTKPVPGGPAGVVVEDADVVVVVGPV
jgi:hypothetical protein